MTTLRAPTGKRPSRNQLRLTASLLSVATFGYLAFITRAAYLTAAQLGDALLTAPTRQNGQLTSWGHVLDASSGPLAALKCSFNSVCSAWFNQAFAREYDLTTNVGPFMLMFLAMIVTWRMVPDTHIRKDPGQGKWFGVTDPQAKELLNLKPRGWGAARRAQALDRSNPRSLYVGHVIPWQAGRFQWDATRLGFLRERDRHENVLVMGAPGSGKTRGVFRQNIALDAHYGRTAVVFDMKWPQMDSGFGDLALYWKRLGRPVYVFAPFSENSMRIPLLEGIDNLDEALKLARAIIAPPEYKDEIGAYYKDNERRALAAMILTIAQGPTPNMRELQRLGQMNVEELENWYHQQTNPEIKNALKAMWDQRKDKISDTLAGVVNKLQIFYTASVSRATSAGSREEEIIDLRALFKGGGLLIIGIEGKHILDGNGEILLQLIKRRIDRAMLDVADASPGGRLPQTATYCLDELPSLGRLPYLMSNLATLRSKRVCMMLGVQNSEQGSVVYTRDYWQALTTNNLGTRVEFIRGTSGEDARTLSEEIGETTVEAETDTASGHAVFNVPWAAESRRGRSVKLEKRPLLSVEEIKRFPRDLAVAFVKGQNPVLVATPALDAPTLTLTTPEGQEVILDNQLYALWQRTMGGVRDIEGDTRALIASLSVQRAPGEPVEVVQDASMYWQEWLTKLLHAGARVRRIGADGKLKLMLRRDSLPEGLDGRDVNYFLNQGWLSLSDSEEELTITKAGLRVAGKLLTASLQTFEATGPALHWVRTHAQDVAGYPGGRVSEGEAVAHYTPETLVVPEDVAREMWGVVPDLPREERGGRVVLRISLSDPTALTAALRRARGEPGPQRQREDAGDAADLPDVDAWAPPVTPDAPSPTPPEPSPAPEPSGAEGAEPTPAEPTPVEPTVKPGADSSAGLLGRLGGKKPRGQA